MNKIMVACVVMVVSLTSANAALYTTVEHSSGRISGSFDFTGTEYGDNERIYFIDEKRELVRFVTTANLYQRIFTALSDILYSTPSTHFNGSRGKYSSSSSRGLQGRVTVRSNLGLTSLSYITFGLAGLDPDEVGTVDWSINHTALTDLVGTGEFAEAVPSPGCAMLFLTALALLKRRLSVIK